MAYDKRKGVIQVHISQVSQALRDSQKHIPPPPRSVRSSGQTDVLWFWKIRLSSYSWFYMSGYLKYVEKHVSSAHECTTQKPDDHWNMGSHMTWKALLRNGMYMFGLNTVLAESQSFSIKASWWPRNLADSREVMYIEIMYLQYNGDVV